MNKRDLPASAGHFDTIMQSWMAANGVPRAAVAVMYDNRLIFTAGYGQGVDERVPIWSLSKAITALCLASLVREGKLQLDDPIGIHLAPKFAEFGEPEDERLRRITVAQLLSHRSGIPRAVDDNMFAPGLVQLLREHPPREASVAMLMPRILATRLVREPGAEFEYSNIGYLLLGQIIEALTAQSYEDACVTRVLAVAGVQDPKLDDDWGGIMQAASGWSLSGAEYLALIRLLHIRPRTIFTPELIRFLCEPNGKWMNSPRTHAYTLGVIIEPAIGTGPTFLHSGGHNWNQEDAAGGPIDEARGTSFVLMDDGVGWFASYDGLSAGTDPEATRALGTALDQACQQVDPWPDIDGFPDLGVQPVSEPKARNSKWPRSSK
jgi:CubicO group peptidase (beta-lactamase class C family)